MTEYTMLDHELLRKEYKENFQKMLTAVKDSPEHKQYAAIEDELNKRQTAIMKSLGIYAPDPCPPKATMSCSDCTGFYRQVKRKSFGKKKASAYKICNESHIDACKCHVKLSQVVTTRRRSGTGPALSTMSEV